MKQTLNRLVIVILALAAIGGWSSAGILAIRTATPAAQSNDELLARVGAYFEARIRTEREGFSVEPVREYLAGAALADAEALDATDPAAIDGLKAIDRPALVILVRGGTNALVQVRATLADAFGEGAVVEQYLLRVVDGEWRIETIFRLDADASSSLRSGDRPSRG